MTKKFYSQSSYKARSGDCRHICPNIVYLQTQAVQTFHSSQVTHTLRQYCQWAQFRAGRGGAALAACPPLSLGYDTGGCSQPGSLSGQQANWWPWHSRFGHRMWLCEWMGLTADCEGERSHEVLCICERSRGQGGLPQLEGSWGRQVGRGV